MAHGVNIWPEGVCPNATFIRGQIQSERVNSHIESFPVKSHPVWLGSACSLQFSFENIPLFVQALSTDTSERWKQSWIWILWRDSKSTIFLKQTSSQTNSARFQSQRDHIPDVRISSYMNYMISASTWHFHINVIFGGFICFPTF